MKENLQYKPIFEQLNFLGIDLHERGLFYVPHSESGRLTYRQRIFARIFAATRKKALSAKLAGYSNKNASKIANELLQKTHVFEAVQFFEEEILREAGIDPVRALQEVAKLAYANIRDAYREDGTLKAPSEWDERTAAAISSVRSLEGNKYGQIKEIKMHDKSKHLELILKKFGIVSEKLELTGKDGAAIPFKLETDPAVTEMIEKIFG